MGIRPVELPVNKEYEFVISNIQPNKSQSNSSSHKSQAQVLEI